MSGVIYTPLTNTTRTRHQRYKRPDTLSPMRETDRDRQIVRLIFDYRLLSQRQLERLLGKSRSTVQQSLIRLYHHQYLERLFMPISRFGSSPTLYTLGKRGIELLRRAGVHNFVGIPSKHSSSFFLAHTLAINEVRLAMTQAAHQCSWSIAEWRTENEIKSDYDRVPVIMNLFKPQKLAVLPDGYFVINPSLEGQTSYFLEVDRGTMPLKRFTTKIAAYVAYYKHGGYTRRFKTKGFRVLTVVDGVGKGRVQGLLAASAGIKGIGRRFWFAHIDEVTRYNPLTDPIWQIAGTEEQVALYDLHH